MSVEVSDEGQAASIVMSIPIASGQNFLAERPIRLARYVPEFQDIRLLSWEDWQVAVLQIEPNCKRPLEIN
jgi:hypothetical protein